MKKVLKAILHYPIYIILRPFIWIYVVIFQHVRFKKNHFKIPKGPILLLSNHLTDWDGIYLLCMFYLRNIHFLVHDELFKNKFFSFVCGTIFGEIKRGMTDNDISDILEMKKLAKEGKTIGVFPEGDIDMFGRTLPIPDTVAKFAKMMNIPVVLLRIEGAYIRAPRWGKYAHHGHITYSVQRILSVDEIKEMDVPSLHKVIIDNIAGDDVQYQVDHPYKQWPGFKRAEWLELGLYMCPHCHQLEVLKSKGDKVYCTKCGFEAKYNRYCFLESKDVPYRTLTAYDDAQYLELCKMIDRCSDEEVILKEENLDFYMVNQKEYFHKPIDKAVIEVYKKYIRYSLEDGKRVDIPITELKRICLQYKDVLELHYGEVRIRFRTKQKKWSAYLYYKAIKYLNECSKKI